jgi:dihydrofolate synthase/folylpolyglutamate synthase
MKTLHDWLAYIERQHPQSIALGLERVREVAMRMGLEKPAAHVITVGGTNGKGSTVAFVDAIARAAGWRVGTYMSPHLLRYNERVRIDGEEVGDATLVEAFEAVEAARVLRQRQDDHEVALTYFEYGTLAALWCFARADLDLAVLEVGLGGRLDAVNMIDADVAVITTVDLDHQDWLGNDREAIGAEKAGIARSWRPLILGEDAPPTSVLDHAYRIGASAVRAGCDFFFERTDDTHWRWREVGFELELPMPRLAAPAQLRNAATAIAALRALDRPIPEEAYVHGIADAFVPGRLQRFARDDRDVVIDVGHNPQAARELAAWLRTEPVQGETFAVFAALADKDVAGVAQALGAQIDGWFLAGLGDVGPRGTDVTTFAERLAGTPAAGGIRHATVAEAFAAALAQTRAGDRILIFGSFHTAAAALQALQSEADAG